MLGLRFDPVHGCTYRAISTTSQSRISDPSTVNRISVRTLCQPCFPAAPGFMCRQPNLGSCITLRICEWPVMKSPGRCSCKSIRAFGVYLPGKPPMWIISTFRSSHDQQRNSGWIDRISYPSMLPKTPVSGRKSASRSDNDRSPKSPACQISSHFSKCRNTASSRNPCVSEIRPIRFNVIAFIFAGRL